VKKMLMITHHNINEGGGDVARVKKIASLLAGSFDVEMFGFGYSSKRLFLLPIWLGGIVRAICKKDWDFVYIYNQRYLVILVGILGRCLGRRHKLIYDAVLTWQLLPYSSFYRAFRGKVEKLAGWFADGVVGVSKMSGDFFGGKTLLVVPTLVDTDAFRRDANKRKAIRAKYDIKRTDRVIGLVGSFDNEYNKPQLEFLRKNLGIFDRRLKFMVIGRVDEGREIINQNVISTGFVDDYAGHLSALDALMVVRTIPTDGAINRMVEAMSVGLPVFANDVAGETMDWGVGGIDYYVSDGWALPIKVNRLVFDGGLMKRVGVCAKRIVREYYSEARYKSRLAEALARC